MTRQAREVLYWSRIQVAILQESAKCSLCARYGSALPREPMLSFISQDRFMQGGGWYFFTVHFARYGIPDTFLSDNGKCKLLRNC